jgi:hypothetical protein
LDSAARWADCGGWILREYFDFSGYARRGLLVATANRFNFRFWGDDDEQGAGGEGCLEVGAIDFVEDVVCREFRAENRAARERWPWTCWGRRRPRSKN